MSADKIEVLFPRGGDMLYLDGYLFYRNKKVEDLHYWECRNRSHTTEQRRNCSSRVVTRFVSGAHILASNKPHHDHEPAPRSAESLKFRDDLKRSVAADGGTPAKLVRKKAVEYSASVQHQLSINAQIKIVKRTRPTVHGSEPTSLENFCVPENQQNAIGRAQFFQGEVEANGEKAKIFTTEGDLRRLAQSRYWVADATFDTVPGLFEQLFSIHGVGPDHTNTAPMVYILMQAKTEVLYQQVLEQVSEVVSRYDIELNPSVILTDFERGMINAFQREFPESRHSGCFFYLSQNIWKRVQANGLVPEFSSSGGTLYEHYKKNTSVSVPSSKKDSKRISSFASQISRKFFAHFIVFGRKLCAGMQKTRKKVSSNATIVSSFVVRVWKRQNRIS